jgi:hypothetical protein
LKVSIVKRHINQHPHFDWLIVFWIRLYGTTPIQVCEAIEDNDGMATAKANIALAKSKYKGGRNKEELVKASREFYELRIAVLGEENEYTIRDGRQCH